MSTGKLIVTRSAAGEKPAEQQPNQQQPNPMAWAPQGTSQTQQQQQPMQQQPMQQQPMQQQPMQQQPMQQYGQQPMVQNMPQGMQPYGQQPIMQPIEGQPNFGYVAGQGQGLFDAVTQQQPQQDNQVSELLHKMLTKMEQQDKQNQMQQQVSATRAALVAAGVAEDQVESLIASMPHLQGTPNQEQPAEAQAPKQQETKRRIDAAEVLGTIRAFDPQMEAVAKSPQFRDYADRTIVGYGPNGAITLSNAIATQSGGTDLQQAVSYVTNAVRAFTSQTSTMGQQPNQNYMYGQQPMQQYGQQPTQQVMPGMGAAPNAFPPNMQSMGQQYGAPQQQMSPAEMVQAILNGGQR